MYDVVIVQCVKSKIWDRDKTAPRLVPAKDAYVSPYFKKMRSFAKKYGKRWGVLSGKYGFLLPEAKIENYDTSFSRSSFVDSRSKPISLNEIKEKLRTDEELRSGLGLDTITTCVVLGGKTYVKVVKEVLSEYQIEIIDPLKGLNFGKKLEWLDRKTGGKSVKEDAVYCIHCGQKLPSEAKFCLRCGQRLPSTSITTEKLSTSGKTPSRITTFDDRTRKLTDVLKDYHEELYEETFSTVERLKTAGLAKDPEDNQFLIDNPNAFLFGVIFDQQIRAERAWAAPHELYKRLGNTLDLEKIVEIGPERLAEILHQSPALHRFCNKLARWLVEASSILLDKYEGNARNIWSGKQVRAVDVIRRLGEFPGISQKKANMTASILVRDFKVPIEGWRDIDIPYDIHIRRVFLRSGLMVNDTQKEVVSVGRKFSPDYPGKLDLPTWYIGRTWCRPQNPDCTNCKLGQYCLKMVGKGKDIVG